MNDLADALRLACRARGSWRTLQGTLTSWTHQGRGMEAHRRASEGRGGVTQMVSFATGSGEAEPPPEEQESTSRLWIELPSRGRSETRTSGAAGGGDWEMTMVVDGDTFWMHDPLSGAITNNGDAGHQGGLGVDTSLLDPVALIVASSVETAGEAVVANRPGILLRLVPRPPSILGREILDAVSWTRSPQELVLDRERGIALSLTSFLDGEPFQRTAFTEIAFDLPIPPERLTFTPPPGEEVRDTRDVYPSHRQEPLHQIAAEADFVVLAARGLLAGWTVVARRMEASERPPMAETVHLFYGSEDGSVQINVNQTASDADTAMHLAPDGAEWRSERRAGTDYRVWEPDGEDWPMARQVVFERGGTRVQVMSSALEVDALVSFAATFVPAPTEPSPPLS